MATAEFSKFAGIFQMNFQMFKLVLEKAEEPKIKLPTGFIDYVKAFDCVDHNKLWKIWKRWEYQTTWPASWETYMQVRKQQIESDMEQRTGSMLGKEYIKAVYSHPAYLTYMQSTSCECQAGWSTNWNQDIREKYQ